jgi:membrane fusion protein
MAQLLETTVIRQSSSRSAQRTSTRNQIRVGDLPLFRPEAMQTDKSYGEVILLRPIALSVFLLLALGFVIAVITFLIFGHYTNKAHSSGILLPDRGLIKLYAPLPGTLLTCHVHEGQAVRKGEILFELSSDRSSLALGSTETEIRDELLSRQQSLILERTNTLNVGVQQQQDLRDRLNRVQEEQLHLASETEATRKKLAIAEQILDRYRQLRSADLISTLELEEKEANPLEQQKALEELERSQVALESERKDLQSQMERIPLQAQVQVAGLERSISEIEGELSEHEVSRQGVVRAPADGTISAILDKVGITVQPNTALATLVPAPATLQAHLFAPSRTLGCVKTGQKAVVRYQAYPSEKFGQQQGVVTQVSGVALSPAEYSLRTDRNVEEPMYEIIVTLPGQSIMLNGQPHALQAGMAVDADILLERHRLIDWMLEPVLNFRRRLAA